MSHVTVYLTYIPTFCRAYFLTIYLPYILTFVLALYSLTFYLASYVARVLAFYLARAPPALHPDRYDLRARGLLCFAKEHEGAGVTLGKCSRALWMIIALNLRTVASRCGDI